MYKEIYLMLTTACPNRCSYCYINHNQEHKSMTFSQCVDLIDTHKPDRVIFFGGEPLLKIDLIEEVLAYYHQYETRPKFQVVTSTMVNFDRFLEINKRYPLDEIQLSFDGIFNSRKDINGNIIGYDVMDTINMLLEKTNLKFDIACVINEENVENLESIHNIFVEWHYKSNGRLSGQFIIAHDPNNSDRFFELLSKNLIKTFDLNKLYRNHLNNIIAYLQKDKNYANCDAGKYTVFTPDGRESFCTALSQTYEKDFSSEILQRSCTHKDCQRCIYKFLCDGGCRYERYKVYGDNWESNYLTNTCKLMKIYYDTIRAFINSLSHNELLYLYSEIERYKEFNKKYHQEGIKDV